MTTVPAWAQRYDTCGDWYETPTGVRVVVSQMPREEYELLVAVHELVEWWLCKRDGITQETVDEWDASHPEGADGEGCPYGAQHRAAERVERVLAEVLGVDWDEYEEALDA